MEPEADSVFASGHDRLGSFQGFYLAAACCLGHVGFHL